MLFTLVLDWCEIEDEINFSSKKISSTQTMNEWTHVTSNSFSEIFRTIFPLILQLVALI